MNVQDPLDAIPRLTAADLARLKALADFSNDEADAPAAAVSVRLDPDVSDWLRAKGQDHQSRVNQILREAMQRDMNVNA